MNEQEIQAYIKAHAEELSQDIRTAPADVINYIVGQWTSERQDRLHRSIDKAIEVMRAEGHHWTGVACVILQCVDNENRIFVNELADIPEAGAAAAQAYRDALRGGSDLPIGQYL